MRLGKFDSYHDVNIPQPTVERMIALTNYLSGRGHLEISFEGTPPKALEKYKMRQPPNTMQQYVYHSDLVFSQGASTASESVVLGTPCVFQSHLRWGYIEDEVAAGLLFRSGTEDILEVCRKYIDYKTDPNYKAKHASFLADKEDIVKLTVQVLEDDRIWKTKKSIDPTTAPFSYDLTFKPESEI